MPGFMPSKYRMDRRHLIKLLLMALFLAQAVASAAASKHQLPPLPKQLKPHGAVRDLCSPGVQAAERPVHPVDRERMP